MGNHRTKWLKWLNAVSRGSKKSARQKNAVQTLHFHLCTGSNHQGKVKVVDWPVQDVSSWKRPCPKNGAPRTIHGSSKIGNRLRKTSHLWTNQIQNLESPFLHLRTWFGRWFHFFFKIATLRSYIGFIQNVTQRYALGIKHGNGPKTCLIRSNFPQVNIQWSTGSIFAQC